MWACDAINAFCLELESLDRPLSVRSVCLCQGLQMTSVKRFFEVNPDELGGPREVIRDAAHESRYELFDDAPEYGPDGWNSPHVTGFAMEEHESTLLYLMSMGSIERCGFASRRTSLTVFVARCSCTSLVTTTTTKKNYRSNTVFTFHHLTHLIADGRLNFLGQVQDDVLSIVEHFEGGNPRRASTQTLASKRLVNGNHLGSVHILQPLV